MKQFSILIKPAGADCNLRCQYCFYLDHLKEQYEKPRMSDEILEKTISTYMQLNQNNVFTFGWQGGEPTLMGLKFFKRVVELQKKHGPANAVVQNGLQTNGTLITEELARFFAKYKFLLGVSLDGPEIFHDYNRKTIDGKSTQSLVMQGIDKLKKNCVEFNILSLINKKTVQHAKEIYQYFKDNGLYFQQYIPCVEFSKNNFLESFSITGEEWGKFLCELFDQWIKYDATRISIRLFNSILEYLVNGRYNICSMQDNCCQYLVVEHDGGVYPCDFFVREEFLLGNVKTGNWNDFLNSTTYKKFGLQKSSWNDKCVSCDYIKVCNGDCQKFRENNNYSPKTLSTLCEGWKKFYAYTLPRFKVLANRIKAKQGMNRSQPNKFRKIGRNSSCPCGSGRKYKNCCFKL
ncbi:MAG: anaerobic sulfatase maturase [Promethearchaeota archaeon]